jgi:hypothetical protein
LFGNIHLGQSTTSKQHTTNSLNTVASTVSLKTNHHVLVSGRVRAQCLVFLGVVYLLIIAFFTVAAGLLLDVVYKQSGISAAAVAGSAGSVLPGWFRTVCAVIVLAMSLLSVTAWFRKG